MATTTNYGWTTPDDTALVKDGASAIRTLGSSVDTTTKNLNPQTTLGDIAYRSSTANVNTRLGIGTNGQVLSVSGGVPSWTTPAGGGKVLQVVSTSTNNGATTTGTSFVDASVSLSITPTLVTSKILVVCAIAGSTNAQNSAGYFTIYRGATHLGGTNGFITVYHNASYSGQFRVGVPMTYLDSPATTSATTYGVYFKTNGVGTVGINSDTTNSTITLLEIGA